MRKMRRFRPFTSPQWGLRGVDPKPSFGVCEIKIFAPLAAG
jgi:hypothetical protein